MPDVSGFFYPRTATGRSSLLPPPPNPLLRETPPAPAEEVAGMRSNVLIATTAIIADIELPIPVLLLDTFHEQKRLPFSIQPWYEMQIQAIV